MKTPAAAIAWDIWSRHRNRLAGIAITIVAFALFYPRLCVLMGLDAHASNALDAIATTASERIKDATVLGRIIEVIGLLLMLLGPVGCMVVSLLFVIWIFTFAQLDAKKGFGFPSRMFTLPVSTNFLAGWLLVCGTAVLGLVYAGWTYLVRPPNIDVFDGYPNFLAWLALMVVSQAVMWALDGHPGARVLILCGVVSGFGFLTGPPVHDHPLVAQYQTAILSACLVLGCVVSFVGLGQIRHGAWQQWTWKWRRDSARSRSTQRGPTSLATFRSAARAQLWFEWRGHFGKSLQFVAGLSGAALLIMSVVAVRVGSLSEVDLNGLVLFLLGVPLLIHFGYGMAPRELPPFLATRPLTSGDFVNSRLTAAALSAVLCWLVTFAMLAVVPLLANVTPLLNSFLPGVAAQHRWPLLALSAFGLVFLTWRFVAADLWLVRAPKAWRPKVTVIKFYVAFLVGLLSFLAGDARFESTVRTVLSALFIALVVLKLIAAQWAFRVSCRRGLLSRAAVLNYLVVWLVITLALVMPALVLFHSEKWIVPIALGLVLLVPLARIGYAPIALSYARHP